MKTNKSKWMYRFLLIMTIFLGHLVIANAQDKPKIALISIDSRNLEWDNTTMANMLRFELEKFSQFEVMDKYDVAQILAEKNISPDESFGKNSLVEAGKLLGADKMLTGSVELFGDKIILILRLIDVQNDRVEKSSVMEYLNVQTELQIMAMISLNDLLDVENDPHLVDLLINYNLPITTRKTTVSLSGPRMGVSMTLGDNGNRMSEPKDQGGYNMYPITTMFGYQFEKQYMSSGDFQALVEVVAAVNGLESGQFIPSLTFLNGFRFNNRGFEFGLGPIVRFIQKEKGFYQDGEWTLARSVEQVPDGVKLLERIDSRGNINPSLGMMIAFGKTFRSGYLNMPVNLYFSPIKSGSVVGITFGFNTTKKPTFDAK